MKAFQTPIISFITLFYKRVSQKSILAQQPNSGPGHLAVDVSRLHTIRNARTHAWQDSCERSARRRNRYLYNTQQTENTNINDQEAFAPAIPVNKRPQTYALYLTATGIDWKSNLNGIPFRAIAVV
jgi:hypothetical protein